MARQRQKQSKYLYFCESCSKYFFVRDPPKGYLPKTRFICLQCAKTGRKVRQNPTSPYAFKFPKSEWTFNQCVDWLFKHGHKEPLHIEYSEKAEFWHFEVRNRKDFDGIWSKPGWSPTQQKHFQMVWGRLTKAAEKKRKRGK